MTSGIVSVGEEGDGREGAEVCISYLYFDLRALGLWRGRRLGKRHESIPKLLWVFLGRKESCYFAGYMHGS